jgi:hypothetical protein
VCRGLGAYHSALALPEKIQAIETPRRRKPQSHMPAIAV